MISKPTILSPDFLSSASASTSAKHTHTHTMASASAPTICTSCLRTMQATARAARPTTARHSILRSPRRSFAVSSTTASATSPPTHLSALIAPSPSPRPRNASSTRQTARPQFLARHLAARPFSTSPPRRAAVLNPRKDEDGNEMIVGITPRAAHVSLFPPTPPFPHP